MTTDCREFFTVECGDLPIGIFLYENLEAARSLLNNEEWVASLLGFERIKRQYDLFQTLHVRESEANEIEYYLRKWRSYLEAGLEEFTAPEFMFLISSDDL